MLLLLVTIELSPSFLLARVPGENAQKKRERDVPPPVGVRFSFSGLACGDVHRNYYAGIHRIHQDVGAAYEVQVQGIAEGPGGGPYTDDAEGVTAEPEVRMT